MKDYMRKLVILGTWIFRTIKAQRIGWFKPECLIHCQRLKSALIITMGFEKFKFSKCKLTQNLFQGYTQSLYMIVQAGHDWLQILPCLIYWLIWQRAQWQCLCSKCCRVERSSEVRVWFESSSYYVMVMILVMWNAWTLKILLHSSRQLVTSIRRL